jgi:hypothetical protein
MPVTVEFEGDEGLNFELIIRAVVWLDSEIHVVLKRNPQQVRDGIFGLLRQRRFLVQLCCARIGCEPCKTEEDTCSQGKDNRAAQSYHRHRSVLSFDTARWGRT